MVGNAVLLLLSSIVGGVLVLAGQTLARRHEDRGLWLTRRPAEGAGPLPHPPWASTVEAERRAMGAAIQDVWATWDGPDEEFQRAYDDARTAVECFTSSVGALLVRPPGPQQRFRPR